MAGEKRSISGSSGESEIEASAKVAARSGIGGNGGESGGNEKKAK